MEEGNKHQVTHKVTVQVYYHRYKQLDNKLNNILLSIAMSIGFQCPQNNVPNVDSSMLVGTPVMR